MPRAARMSMHNPEYSPLHSNARARPRDVLDLTSLIGKHSRQLFHILHGKEPLQGWIGQLRLN